MAGKRKALGQRLIDEGLITSQQLDIALREQKRTGELLGTILKNLGFITEENLSRVLSSELDIPHVSLSNYAIDPSLLLKIPKELAKRHRFIPLFLEDNTLTVSMVDPYDIMAIDAIQQKTGYMVKVVASTETEILKAIDQYYGTAGSLDNLIEETIGRASKVTTSTGDSTQVSEGIFIEPPIIELVNQIIAQAIVDRATDIHIEPEEKLIRTRYRIDGILYQGPSPPKELQAAIISRIKIMANLNISEKRAPQDGRIQFTTSNKEVDLRVSIYPTVFGENIVLRVLDKSNLVLGLEELGFSSQTLSRLTTIVEKPHGILLVTGPTGAGKTTTLYSILTTINSLERNIMTIEDPVEYQLPLIRQSQVNPAGGLTFAAGLRSILRQDPDVIMVGEIRDQETAGIAIRSALTGHFVLSSLHTNSACGAIPRLLDTGIEPFLLSSSIAAAIAQRLARKICPKCKVSYTPSPEEIAWMKLREGEVVPELYEGKGCEHCTRTGYRGRIGIFEILIPNKRINELVVQRGSEEEIREEALKQGMKLMRDDGIEKAKRGLITISEVMRVTEG
ncbi:MAG: Flp pilus assembly complex ATPase component [Nitrospirae bacterium]|nr:Flp pilus assembly complex ATPase component [Nitrospirota bacterium]